MTQKLSQKEIREMADEWATMCKKIDKAEAAEIAELKPYLEKLQADTAEIAAKYSPKLAKLRERRDAIESQVTAWLTAQGKAMVVSGKLADAVNDSKLGSRVLNAQKFFDFVKEKNDSFWACLSVGIAKAEELIGKKRVDAMATKPTKLVASLKLK